jgi:hypothetical protein
LEAFLDPLIGIAKRAKVLPGTPSRALLAAIHSSPGPPFFGFVTKALDIAMDVIRSSPLWKFLRTGPCARIGAAAPGMRQIRYFIAKLLGLTDYEQSLRADFEVVAVIPGCNQHCRHDARVELSS